MTIDLIKSSEFSFWVPMDLCKSENAKAPQGKRRWIQGIASTPDRDLQKESVIQHGIDFSYFLEYGYYNNDHKPGFENKVGQPTEAKIVTRGFWTKGYLFENHKVSDAIWELAHALLASQSDRQLGFSIQGKVLRRAGAQILKCWVQDVAITAAPINTNTWLDVVKSINAVPQEMWCDDNGCYPITPDVATKSQDCVRSLSEVEIDLKKKKEQEEEAKAFSTGTAGGALIPESLDRKYKDQQYGRAINKALEFNECVSLLQSARGLSRLEATVLTEAVFAMDNTN